jgi:hypothetical protein
MATLPKLEFRTIVNEAGGKLDAISLGSKENPLYLLRDIQAKFGANPTVVEIALSGTALEDLYKYHKEQSNATR